MLDDSITKRKIEDRYVKMEKDPDEPLSFWVLTAPVNLTAFLSPQCGKIQEFVS